MQPQGTPPPPSPAARKSPRGWVLLDRDGVINQEKPGSYVLQPEEWVPIPGSPEAIARLCEGGLGVIVLTNQSAIGRGLLDLDTLEAIHAKLIRTIEESGGHIAGIFFCPHHPDEDCECRKPKAGLIHQAERSLGCSLEGAPMVGDQSRDLQAARQAGCRPILVRTGRGREVHSDGKELEGVAVYETLSDAVTEILKASH